VRGTAQWKPAAGEQPKASPMAQRQDTSTGAVYGPEEFVVNQEELKIAVLESEEQWKEALCKDTVRREKEVCTQVI